MTTIAELVDTEPAPTAGVEAGFEYATGTWRHVVELADPSAGSSVEWFDITEYLAGYEYNRGADSYQGRYRASVATIDLFAPDDRYAPWNDDTSEWFGDINVSLGPGLLIRSGFILVDGGVVTQWNPRFTLKVEYWGDASYSRGKVRQHRIVARDTLTSLVGVPIGASVEENWSDRVDHVLTEAGWEYGYTLYGATTIGGVGVLPLPARDAQASAINELDATVDPAGCCWYTNRKGQLIVRPTVYDTWQAGRFTAGAAGTPYPEPDPVSFAWWSCSDETPPGDYGDLDTETTAAYAVDTRGVDPFGLDRSENGVINHVIVTSPSGTFDDDDPTSIQRYDRHTLQTSWITANDFVAADILAARANATIEARPLTTTLELTRFHPGPALVDYLDDLSIWHRNSPVGLEVNADGWLRSYRELVRPRGCDTEWTLQVTFDVFESSSRNPALLPVVNLELTTVTELAATFTWENPTQVIEPTHTQIRMLNPTSEWTTTSYPITGVVWSGLAPYTAYEFQVRLIRVDDTIVTHFSPVRSVIFITDEPDVPYVEPPDTPGGGIDVTFPPPDEGCDLEWELQSSPDGTTWTTIDDGTVPGPPPFQLEYDDTLLDDELLYRFRSREVCSGTPGDWHDSPIFTIDCLPVDRLSDPPYDDANLVAFWPQVCASNPVEEAISNEPMTPGGAFNEIGVDSGGEFTMTTYGQGVIGSGVTPNPVAGSSDASISCRISFGELPDGEVIIFGANGLYFTAETSGGGYVITGNVYEAGTGVITIGGGPTVLALGTEYTLTLTHAVGGTLSLYVDGELEDASVSTIDARSNTLGLYSIGAPADSWVTDCAVWDVVLTFAFTPTDIPDCEVWLDADDAGTFTFGTGTNVATWADKSGNGHDFVQATSGSQPARSATIGGLAAVDFDGTADHLRTAAAVQFVNTSTSDWTAFAVIETDTNAAGTAHVLDGDDGAVSTDRVARLLMRDAGAIQAAHGNTGGAMNTDTAISDALATTTPTLAYAVSDGTDVEAFHEGLSIGATAIGGTPRTGSMKLTLGARWTSGAATGFWNGRIAEVIVYRRALTGSEIIQVEDYLRTKWGLPTIAATLSDAITALSPVGYWKLDDPSGTTAADSSGNGRTGTYSGTFALATWAGGDGVNYADFGSGSQGRCRVADNSAFSATSGLTLLIFCRPEATELASTANRALLTKLSGTGFEYELKLGDPGGGGVVRHNYFTTTGNTLANEKIGSRLTANSWSMVVAASATPSLSLRYDLYVDSSYPLASTAAAGVAGTYADTTAPVEIGNRNDGGGGFWHGGLAHAAIFTGKLTAAQVTSIRFAAIKQGWTTV